MISRAWKVGPALAVGCTIVMKPSEVTPLSALVRLHSHVIPVFGIKLLSICF